MDESTLSFIPRSHFLMRTCVVILTSDEDVIIDNVCFALPQRRLSANKVSQELNRILAPLPVGCSLLVHILLFYFVLRLAHAVSFRLFLTRPILEPCLTFLTTIAITSTYHGYLRASVGRPWRITTVCVCIMHPLVVR